MTEPTMSAQLEILTGAEANRLRELEAIVERGMQTFVEVGLALAGIRDARLYRQTHATFQSYCHDRWTFSRQRALQLIDAAEMTTMVVTAGLPAPANERQARELAGDDDPAEAWADVIEVNGDKPTAAQTRAVVQERRQLKDPATPKQVAYLRSLGHEPDGPISKKTASKRITELAGHRICTCTVCGQHWDREKRRGL